MAKETRGAQYGVATQEEHRASGYRLPDHFYKAPEVDEQGNPVAPVATNEDGSSVSSVTPAVANKAVLPTRAQRKSTKKKK